MKLSFLLDFATSPSPHWYGIRPRSGGHRCWGFLPNCSWNARHQGRGYLLGPAAQLRYLLTKMKYMQLPWVHVTSMFQVTGCDIMQVRKSGGGSTDTHMVSEKTVARHQNPGDGRWGNFEDPTVPNDLTHRIFPVPPNHPKFKGCSIKKNNQLLGILGVPHNLSGKAIRAPKSSCVGSGISLRRWTTTLGREDHGLNPKEPGFWPRSFTKFPRFKSASFVSRFWLFVFMSCCFYFVISLALSYLYLVALVCIYVCLLIGCRNP